MWLGHTRAIACHFLLHVFRMTIACHNDQREKLLWMQCVMCKTCNSNNWLNVTFSELWPSSVPKDLLWCLNFKVYFVWKQKSLSLCRDEIIISQSLCTVIFRIVISEWIKTCYVIYVFFGGGVAITVNWTCADVCQCLKILFGYWVL